MPELSEKDAKTAVIVKPIRGQTHHLKEITMYILNISEMQLYQQHGSRGSRTKSPLQRSFGAAVQLQCMAEYNCPAASMGCTSVHKTCC
jgi:hypothetical protein